MINIRDNISGDERRRRDEAQLEALQKQVEELRRLLGESVGRQGIAEEAQRKLRGEVEEIERRLTAAVAPVPHLQSQITDLGAQTRERLQELGQDQRRFGELQGQIDRLPPQLERNAELARAVREEVLGLRGEVETIRKDWQKVGDTVGIVEQDARRRLGDLTKRADEADERLKMLKDEMPPLRAQIDRVRSELHGALPRFDALDKADVDLQEAIDRAAAIAFERHAQMKERGDEVREALEERIRQIERLNDARFGSTMSRFTELEEADRAIGHRITLLAVRLDELRDQDAIIRLEVRRLEEMRIKIRLEQAQHEAMTFSERLAQLQAELEGDDEDDL